MRHHLNISQVVMGTSFLCLCVCSLTSASVHLPTTRIGLECTFSRWGLVTTFSGAERPVSNLANASCFLSLSRSLAAW
ncbi:hypothetical protein F4776DRAFT_624220 [Hypoxylon sp. NC0597]|nr:hypothetical protein F4776DRAFT_624220 [Hypoxylon sp. NC0597]